MEDPNIPVSVTYICERTGEGITVHTGSAATPQQEALAMAMVSGCEENGGCPPDCPIKMLAERRI